MGAPELTRADARPVRPSSPLRSGRSGARRSGSGRSGSGRSGPPRRRRDAGSPLLRYALRRLLVSVPVVLLSTFVAFLVVTFSGDPLQDFKAQQRRQGTDPALIAERVRLEERFLRLDHPVLERYWLWIKGVVLHGDFGPSRTVPDIGAELGRRLLVSLRLVALALLLAVILALVVGVVSAVRRGRPTDHVLTLVSVVFLSLPVFWFAVLLKDYLAVDLNTAVGHRLLFTMGQSTPNLQGGVGAHLADAAAHLVLPTLVLGATLYPSWSRFQRTAMIEVLDADHVRLARAKGLPRRRVLLHHALRTALIPLVTVVAVDFASLIGSTVITEQIFSWQGMGTLLLDAISGRDVYVVLAWMLVVAAVVVVVNLVADLLYALLDPRIRIGGGRG